MSQEEFPVIRHSSLGADCCGYVVVRISGDSATVVCDECNATIYTCPAKEAREAISQMLRAEKRKSASG